MDPFVHVDEFLPLFQLDTSEGSRWRQVEGVGGAACQCWVGTKQIRVGIEFPETEPRPTPVVQLSPCSPTLRQVMGPTSCRHADLCRSPLLDLV
uniref:Uncharacterized protein n=1 Tax=Physcomitrium patens TaxID=3218 RepID=A0A2K1J4P4_PHYPA|nr:hypothetical protein PHYPA_022350 [Physcomitrium patens]